MSGVEFTRDSARRIADVVRTVEQQTAPRLGQKALPPNPGRPPLRVIIAEDVPACGSFVCVVTEPVVSSEIWIVSFSGTPGGSVTLTFDFGSGTETTDDIDYPSTAAAVTSAIEALSSVPVGSVDVTRYPGRWLIEFNGSLGATVVSADIDTTNLSGGDAEIEAGCDWVDSGRTVKAREVIPGANGQVFAGWIGTLQHFPRFGWGLTGAECRDFVPEYT